MDYVYEIASGFWRKDWIERKAELEAELENNELWKKAYNDFCFNRINERYLKPIKAISAIDPKNPKGEGFSIISIICCLIEFLEALYQGKNYKQRNVPSNYKYNDVIEMFISFLTNRGRFKDYFDEKLAKEFYKKVRCGLLHELQTKDNWTINVYGDHLLNKEGEYWRIDRENFFEAIKEFIDDYKKELLQNKERKLAFIRKFDYICQIQ